MQMDAGLDTGPTLLAEPVVISRAHTSGSLHDELSVLGAPLLIAALTGLERGTLAAVEQPSEGVTYAHKIEKREAVIDWNEEALAIERRVRAFNPWPIAQTHLDGQVLRVFAAHAEDEGNVPVNGVENHLKGTIIAVQDDFMRVQCGTGTLAVTQVQRPGGRIMSVRDFAHHRKLPGRRLG